MRERVLVLGLGRFGGGLGAARYLATRGARVRVADRADAAALAPAVAALAGLDIDWRLGCETPDVLDGVDRIVVNPAVPDGHPLLRAAGERGIPQTQEVDLFLGAYPGRVCLITGTNGKSTTTALLARALAAAGIDVLAGGNLGRSLLDDVDRWRVDQVAVVEISSFQLARLAVALPCAEGTVAVRITRDHLDRHGTLAGYHAAKARAAAAARGFFVHAADDPVAATFASPARERIAFACRAPGPGEVGIEDGVVVSRLPGAEGPGLAASALRLLGAFNLENAMAAFAAAVRLGAARHAAAFGIATAPPLPHRLQHVARLPEGIDVFDDAVSTDADSTAAALRTLAGSVRGTVHWVGGGKSKDGDFARAAATLRPHVRAAHLFGAAARPLAAALGGGVEVSLAEGLTDALDAARRTARPGDAILFSPGFASFDQYPNFRARAEHFHAWLRSARTGMARVEQATAP